MNSTIDKIKNLLQIPDVRAVKCCVRINENVHVFRISVTAVLAVVTMVRMSGPVDAEVC